MCEVTSQNFEEKYPEIIKNLKSALFISIDCEFSGLLCDKDQCSLFDSPQARFGKLQEALKDFSIIQFGLSTFRRERATNSFTASTYTFYLLPSALVGNSKFQCHLKSLEFLCKHKFDFNKLFYCGIEYLNMSDEAELLRMINDRNLLDSETIQKIQNYCSVITVFSLNAEHENEMVLELTESKTFMWLLYLDIKKRFPNLRACFEKPGVIKIRKLEKFKKKKNFPGEEETLKKELINSVLGFSRIIREIENLKKPIIGHNFLIDLIMIYKQFYSTSSISYKTFKKAITNIFPTVYDTKNISFELRTILSKYDRWCSNSLSELYNYLHTGLGSRLVAFSPNVNHTNDEFLLEKNFHEAGFDSYCTGYCFIKMAFIFSKWDADNNTFISTIPLSSTWLFNSVQSLKNRVNLSRGKVNHIVLDSNDPKSARPHPLSIKSKTHLPLDILQISKETARFASVDIQLFNKYSGIMAVSNQKELKEVLDYFKNHKEVKVSKYNGIDFLGSRKFAVIGTIIASIIVFGIWTSNVRIKQ